MRHIEGISVSIRRKGGAQLSEYDNPFCKQVYYFERTIGSRSISLQDGTPFEVHIKFEKTFKIYGSRGVKIVIAYHAEHMKQQGVQAAQIHWLEFDSKNVPIELVFDHFKVWDDKPRKVPFLIPTPAANPKDASDEWLRTEDVYLANLGCLSIFIERGEADVTRGIELLMGKPIPARNNTEPTGSTVKRKEKTAAALSVIRHYWFVPSTSKHGTPYAFEFRNLDKEHIDATTAKEHVIHDDPFHDSASDDETLASTGSDSEEEYRPCSPKAGPKTRLGTRSPIEEFSDEEEEVEKCSQEELGRPRTLRSSSSQKILQQRPPLPRTPSPYESPEPLDAQTITKDTPRTAPKMPLRTSSAIKRKLVDDEDQDDEEYIIKTDADAEISGSRVHTPPRAPFQPDLGLASPFAPTSQRQSNVKTMRASPSSAKRARLLRIQLEELQIRKQELALQRELEELEDE